MAAEEGEGEAVSFETSLILPTTLKRDTYRRVESTEANS